MPSVKVPLQSRPGWSALMIERRKFWNTNGNMNVSPHFRAYEFYCNDGSPCPIVARPAIVALCRVFLEPMRDEFGTAYVISGYRHVLYNAKIGGVINSQHIYEMSYESVAADLRFARGHPAAWAKEARRIRATKNRGKGGVGQYDRAGFVHIDNRAFTADWSGAGE